MADEGSASLRPMTEADLPVVVDLEAAVFTDNWPRSAFLEALQQDSWSLMVAERDRDVIGYAAWQIIADEAHLTNIAVAPEHRRKSVAKQMLEHILVDARNHACQHILLEVRPHNEAAIAFYEKHGFEEWYRRPGYYRQPVEDALVMVRSLQGQAKDDG